MSATGVKPGGSDSDAAEGGVFVAFSLVEGAPCRVRVYGDRLVVADKAGKAAEFTLSTDTDGVPALEVSGLERVSRPQRAIAAVLECLFASRAELERIRLAGDPWCAYLGELGRLGLVSAPAEAGPELLAEMFWQAAGNWTADAGNASYPLHYTMTGGQRHPLRPVKPRGTVYARYIPWLGSVLSLRAVSLGEDLGRFHRWMNDPRVAVFWEEEGDLGYHRRYLASILEDPHMIPLIACADGEAFAYFEVYWAKENRLGPFYDAQDYDRGWHVLIGEDAYRGKGWVAAWLPSLMHYLFLDDCRTQRIVGEPRSDHAQQLRNLRRSGFAQIKNFDFPHKRATLVMLLRERFFGDRLWHPAPPE